MLDGSTCARKKTGDFGSDRSVAVWRPSRQARSFEVSGHLGPATVAHACNSSHRPRLGVPATRRARVASLRCVTRPKTGGLLSTERRGTSPQAAKAKRRGTSRVRCWQLGTSAVRIYIYKATGQPRARARRHRAILRAVVSHETQILRHQRSHAIRLYRVDVRAGPRVLSRRPISRLALPPI